MIRPLYKAVEPFMEVKRGHGYQGVVMYDDAEDKVQCHLCGKYFESLGGHIAITHKASARSYRLEYGLSLRTPLCGKALSRAHSKAARRDYSKKKCGLVASARRNRTRTKHYVRPAIFYSQTQQHKNRLSLCELQKRARYDVVKNIVGREPSWGDLKRHDSKLLDAINRMGGLTVWRKMVNARKINPGEYRILPDTVLIAAIRKRGHELGRTPRASDFRKSKNPSLWTLYRAFGSWFQALRMAGIK